MGIVAKARSFMLAALVAGMVCMGGSYAAAADTAAAVKPTGLTQTTPDKPLSFSPILSWSKDIEAVSYEIEFFAAQPAAADLPPDQDSPQAIYRTNKVYMNQYNPALREFAAAYLGRQPLYWRVRPLDFDRRPAAPYSDLAVLYTSATQATEPEMTAPVPGNQHLGERGMTMLYRVYNWIGMADAASYEVDVYAANPEQLTDLEPTERLYTENLDVYDEQPHYGEYNFFWRVRGIDSNGSPLGNWSRPMPFRVAPSMNYEVAVLGDSISHGGGHYSYGPHDAEFSWLHYLDFEALNLAKSGDTSADTLARFDRDVLPFHPRYLLILTGSNSLRGGTDPYEVIDDLEAIRQKCLANGIRPVLLTLPPINADSIMHVFQEGTAAAWRQNFAIVNNYIRSQVHIDTAQAIPTLPDGSLPPEYGLDGLHPDANGKRLMGEAVNRAWPQVRLQADAELGQ